MKNELAVIVGANGHYSSVDEANGRLAGVGWDLSFSAGFPLLLALETASRL